MTSKLSRSVIAALAAGACGLVVVPAASAADTQYFVNAPAVTGALNVTPESAVVTGAVDTGGTPGTQLTVAAGTTLSWVGGVNMINSSSKPENFWVDGIPTSGSNSTAYIGSTAFANAGANNYSDVKFLADPVSDYVANGGTPGVEEVFGDTLEVPTRPGLTAVRATLGAFGRSAQNNSDQSPLTPGTKYYYWISDQAGTTDNAEDVNTYNGTTVTTNPTYSCLPIGYINTVYPTYTATGTIAGQPEIQGPCVYQFGTASGIDFYQSPTGEFTTPKLGKLAIERVATVTGHSATLKIADMSAYRAAGEIQLTRGGRVLASGRFHVAPGGHGVVALTLNGRGMKAAASHAKAKLVLTSNWDQPTSTKLVTL